MKNWVTGAVVMHLLAFGAWAETVELVTYYPAPGQTGDQHATSLTVGNEYAGEALQNGQAIIYSWLGVGPGFTAGNRPAAPLPTEPLEVAGNILSRAPTAQDSLFISDRAGTNRLNGLRLRTSDAVKWTIGSRNDSAENLHVYSDADSATRLFIEQGTGNIGIGTTTPDGRLHVTGVNDGLGRVLLMPGTDTAAAGVPEMRLGVGTNAPTGPLHVVGKNDAASVVAFMPGTDTAAAGTPEIRVGVGTTTPTTAIPPTSTTGNGVIDVNDVWLRSVNRWASQGSGAPDYDSGWVADNSATDHYTTFNHNFGDFPSRTEIWFATSNNPTVIYPINWSWIYNYSGNPVTISMTTTQVRFSIVASDTGWLHGVWEPNRSLPNAGWTFYGSGYWRVKCWK